MMNTDSDIKKPVEGKIKPGGWGAKNDANSWQVAKMKDNPNLFKIVDDQNMNVATDFSNEQSAQNFIAYYKKNKFPPEETGILQSGGNGITKYGVKLTYSDGQKTLYDHEVDPRPGKDDGIRYNFNGLKKGEFASAELIGYFKFTKDPVDDEVSGKFSYMSHSDHNEVQCYDMGVGIQEKKSRLRFENPHPDYTGNLAEGQKDPVLLNDKWIGYKFIKKVNPDGTILCEAYQDVGDNEGEKPANNWVRIFTHTDDEFKKGNPPDGHAVTLRIDDPEKEGQKNLRAKWISLSQI
jgi:hypothetical protein